jgi:hypothetical protein
MPIDVQCEECGHELSVSDSMAGRMGRCPECDTVIEIPAGEGKPPAPRGGAFTAIPRSLAPSPTGGLTALSNLLSVLAVISLLGFAYIGVYTGVTAFKGAEAFGGPFGLFESDGYADAAEDSPTVVGIAFCLGGVIVGVVCYLLLLGTAQATKLFVSLERSMKDLATRLADQPDE